MASPLTVQHPLLVFSRVLRHSGLIERECRFTLDDSRPLLLEVETSVPESSWIQVYNLSHPPSRPHPNRLELSPGENRVAVAFNTDSYQFPRSSLRGRLTLRSPGSGGEIHHEIDFHFESIEEPGVFPGFAAIDLGTSSTSLALYHLERDAGRRTPRNPPLEEGATEMPSALLVEDFRKFHDRDDRGVRTGARALEAFREHPLADPRCLQMGTKLLLDRPQLLVADLRGSGGTVTPTRILTALAREARDRARGEGGTRARLEKLIVPHPPGWSLARIARWREVFRDLGYTDRQLDTSLDEASAAALHYLSGVIRDRDELDRLLQDLVETRRETEHGTAYTLHLLAFDFGGGTLDQALVEVDIELVEEDLHLTLRLAGSESLDYGGDRLTLSIFRQLKRRIALLLADPERHDREESERTTDGEEPEFEGPPPASSPFASASFTGDFLDPPDRHRELLEEHREAILRDPGREALDDELEAAIESSCPTRFLPAPGAVPREEARANFDWLWGEAERLKHRLSREITRVEVDPEFPDLEAFRDVKVRLPLTGCPLPELAELADRLECPWLTLEAGAVHDELRPALDRALEIARELVEERPLARVVLSGQSCHFPPVRWQFSLPRNRGGLGMPPARVIFDPTTAKSAVSRGACLLPVLRETVMGVRVDVDAFHATLREEIVLERAGGEHETLFTPGPLQEPRTHFLLTREDTFPSHLTLMTSRPHEVLGHVDFTRPLLREEIPEDLLDEAENSETPRPEPGRPVVGFYLTSQLTLHASRTQVDGETTWYRLQAPPQDHPETEGEHPFSGRH